MSATPLKKVSLKEIWYLTWPQFLMMLCQFIVGSTDLLVAGKIDYSVRAAMGLVTQCFFFLMVIGTTIASSSVAAMSQSLGAGKQLRAQRYLGMVLSLGLAFCLLTLLLGYGFRHQLMWILNVNEDILDLTTWIWCIYLLVIPGQYLLIFSSSAFRAYKNVRIPLYAAFMMCVINGFLDFGLGLGWFGLPALGASGLVIATIIAVSFGGLFNLYMLCRMGILRWRCFAPLRWQRAAVGYLIKVAIPAGSMQFAWQLGYLVLMSITSALPRSVPVVSGMAVGMRVESMLFLPAVAFNFTGTILSGYYLGAGDMPGAKRTGLWVLLTGCGLMSFVALLLWFFLEPVVNFMSAESKEGFQYAMSYMHYNIFSTPFTIGSMILGGILTGAGATIYPFIVYAGSTWLVRLPLAWFLGHVYWQSPSGIFCAMLVSQIVQCTIILWVFLKCDWGRFAMRNIR